MKKRYTTALTLALAGILATPALPALALPFQAKASNESFAGELADLIKSQDDSNYFGSLKLQINQSAMTMDGEMQDMSAAPEKKNGRTALPIRPIAEAAGASVSYEPDSKTVVIHTKTGETIECPIGSSQMTVNGQQVTLDSSSYMSGGRSYLPVRAVAEAMSMDVDWYSETSTVTISAPYQSCRVVAWANSDLDVSGLHAKKTIHDGDSLWVMQFDTPSEAKAATEMLQAKGIAAQGDTYIPPISDTEGQSADMDSASAHKSWGVDKCFFDKYKSANNLSNNSKEIKVSVVDTGLDKTHSFLSGKVLSGGYDFVDNDNDPNDLNSHGTHVGGTIVDCCSGTNVKLLPVRVLDKNGSGSMSAVIAGVKYAADHGSDVINLSLGGGCGGADALDAAINYSVNKGVTVCVAAGNENSNTSRTCPAHITTPGVITVSAGDINFKKANFSNFGKSVDLMAPGVNITSSVPGGKYDSYNGTSMATPHVSAACALIDMATNKTLSPAEIEKRVQASTNGNGNWKDQYVGYGFLDMSKGGGPSPSPTPTITGYKYNVSKLDLKVGQTASVKVTAMLSDGSTKDVTNDAKLKSYNTSVVTVSSSGQVSAKGTGSTYIDMGFTPMGNISIPKPIEVKVSSPDNDKPDKPNNPTNPDDPDTSDEYVELFWAVGRITDTSSTISLSKGDGLKIQVKGRKKDGTIDDVTNLCQVYSSDESVIKFSSGQVTAVGTGTAYLDIASAPNVGLTLPPLLIFNVS